MHLIKLPTILALLTATIKVTGTHIYISSTTGPGILPVSDMTLLTDDGGKHRIIGKNGEIDGCRTRGYWWLNEFCMDSGKKRAHLRFTSNPGLKICFKQTSSKSELCGGDDSCFAGVCNRCWESYYTGVKCDW
jgi:hypothetical protein